MAKYFLAKGKLTQVEDSAKPDYYAISTTDFFSAPTNMIPRLSGISGGRVMLGDKASLQAVSLVEREAPLVRGVSKHGEQDVYSELGEKIGSVIAKNDGTVTSVDKDKIVIGKDTYELYDNFLMGRKSFIHNYSKVKVGDNVKKGDLLATSNYTDDNGVLALGKNLTTAVMPYRAMNFEDAYVVSQAGADKLKVQQMFPVTFEKTGSIIVDKSKFISLFPSAYTRTQLAKIGPDGVIRQGEKVLPSDPLILAYEPRSLKTLDKHLGRLDKLLKHAFNDLSQTWDYESEGSVIDVSNLSSHIAVHIKTIRRLQNGSKISIFSGAKGVVSVVPSEQMPTTADGKPIDVILNTMSITSRIAPGMLPVMALGKVALKTGKPVEVTSFDKESITQHAIDELKKHGLSDKELIYDPISNTHLNVFVGPAYLNTLVHIAEDKTTERSEGTGYTSDMQPSKSGVDSSKKIGNLATAALLSHSARKVLQDIGAVRATRNDEFWRNLKLGLPQPAYKVPFVFDKFLASLQSAGIKVNQDKDEYHILPQTNKDIGELSKGVIENPDTYRVKGDNLVYERGGMFDETKTGLLGDRYNHIDLHQKVINPIVEDYIRKTLKITKAVFDKELMDGTLFPKLENFDLDKELEYNRGIIKKGKGATKDNAVKVFGFLNNLKNNNLHPKDFILDKIPVIPARFRPIAVKDGMVLSSGINELYKELMLINKANKDLSAYPPDIQDELKKKQYAAVKAVYGLGTPVSTKSIKKNYKGILSQVFGIKGGSAKSSFYQSNVINKPVDLVGRAVLTPDGSLNLDEASVPVDIVWKMYSPFIIRRLVQRGVPMLQAKEYVDKRHSMAQQSLMEELKDRPGMVTRDPILHKYNIQGFYLKPNADPKDMTIKISPLVYKGMTADNDGDQLNVHLPATYEAKEEIKEKMMPSSNLISPRSFSPMFTPSNEAALGLYLASTENNKKETKKFKNEQEALAAFKMGKVGVGDNVEIG